MKRSYDVAIVGGGPAGTATALALRTHAPSLSVVLLEASRYEEVRIGESLPPPARQLLEHLGVWDAFERTAPREVWGTVALWGADGPKAHDFLLGTQGAGWHLDRAAFDLLLAREAERRGVAVFLGARLRDAEPAGPDDEPARHRPTDRWRLCVQGLPPIAARFVVDATGRAAAVARRRGARFVASDRLVGFARFYEERLASDPRGFVEAFPDGWWYTAGLPNRLRLVACMTDADVARRLRLSRTAQWAAELAATERVRMLVDGASPLGPLIGRASESRHLEAAAGEDWLAVGDAASIFDPLSSQCVMKALRSGAFASYAIGDLLVKGNAGGLERYRRFVYQEFSGYLKARAAVYAEEGRWGDRDFWRRRHAA